MAKTEIWLQEYYNLAPDLYKAFEKLRAKNQELNDPNIIKDIYESIKSESVDYALLEKSKKVLGYSPTINLDEGIMLFIDWYKKYNQ